MLAWLSVNLHTNRMPVFNRYEYNTLQDRDSIRVLFLLPSANNTSPLRCQILHIRLSDSNSSFSAISHTWGEDKPSETLEIKNGEDVTYLKITQNVETILKNCRDATRPRRLWIDSICLNQHDELEKAHQIPLMGNIYSQATAVHIWLGPGKESTAAVLAFFRKLSHLPDVSKWKYQYELAKVIFSFMQRLVHPNAGVAMKAIYGFFQDPWFGRRWIIQEACLARHGTVHCGKNSIELKTLSEAAIRLQRMDISDYPTKVAANLGPQTSKYSMLELLWHFHDSQCREPKDRIAAFQSLACDGKASQLDYTKDWEDIYKEVALFSLNSNDNDTRLQILIHLFEFGVVRKVADPTYPSWVPNWSRSRRRALPYTSKSQNFDTFEPYPHSPGDFGQASCEFRSGHMRVISNLSGTAGQILRVSSTMTHRHLRCSGTSRSQITQGIIENLFPSVAYACLEILSLTLLLKTISEFRDPVAHREKTSRSLGTFEKNIETLIPNGPDLLIWLRTLESVLDDFCLVEFEVSGQAIPRRQGFAIGAELMQADDVVVPLWGVGMNRSTPRNSASLRENIMLFTGVAVRRLAAKEQARLDELSQTHGFEIICPVIGVIWKDTCNVDSSSPYTKRGFFKHMEESITIL